MKKLFAAIALALFCFNAFSADEIVWTRVEASELTLLGKGFDTPNPYHRVDTCIYNKFDKAENNQARSSAGLTVMFKTDAERIGICCQFGYRDKGSYNSYRGFDLYIMDEGKWKWAGTTSFSANHEDAERIRVIVKNMAPGEKECLLYLPIYSELLSCGVCVPEGSAIAPMESTFKHSIVFHGSSFTQGISCTRSGMSYPMQFMRKTGFCVIPMGFSGHCKMQPYMADMIADIEADAYVFDPFSNPGVKTIRERLEPFVARMVEAHPGKPIIVQRTIYWESENFDTHRQQDFQARRALSDSLMPILCKRYPDVYYIKTDAALHNGESSTADGTHPNDNGYSLWEASIEKPILKILRKYGIK